MSGYTKFTKDMVTKKRSVSFKNDDKMMHCSVIDTIGLLHFTKALCDLGVA